MTSRETIAFVMKTFKSCGALDYRPPYPHQNYGQYRWRCSHQDAWEVARAFGAFFDN